MKEVLGWSIDSRRLTIGLPQDKHDEWTGDIVNILSEGGASYKSLETILGRLNHAAFVMPLSRHYLNHLRNFMTHLKHHKITHISKEVRLDLKLWLTFLDRARLGISMNLIVDVALTIFTSLTPASTY